MIYVKTRMRRIPKGCNACHDNFYKNWDNANHRSCRDCIASGKLRRIPDTIRISSERPAWCPLVEIEGERK